MPSLDKTIEDVELFFSRNTKKNPACHYRLYAVKNRTHPPMQKNLKTSNFETTDSEEAIELLEQDIKLHGATAPAYFILKHLSSSTDSNPSIFIFENPFYSEAAVSGFGAKNQNNNQFQQMLTMQQMFMEKTNDLEKQLIAEKNDRRLEYIQAEIEGIKNQNKNLGDSIKGFLDSETGSLLAASIIGIVKDRLQPQQQPIIQQTINEQPQQQQTFENEQKTDIGEQEKLNNSMIEISEVFGDDFLNVMQNLSAYCKSNPEAAKALFNSKKAANNG